MKICRIFENPDGSVRVMRLNPRYVNLPDVDITAFLDKETAKQPELQGLSFKDISEFSLPKSRNGRGNWRLRNGAVVVDNSVSSTEHPKQAVIDRLNAATTIAGLKTELVQAIRNNDL